MAYVLPSLTRSSFAMNSRCVDVYTNKNTLTLRFRTFFFWRCCRKSLLCSLLNSTELPPSEPAYNASAKSGR